MEVKPDVKGAALLLAIGLFFTVNAYFIPLPLMMQDVVTTPAFFPTAVGSIFSFLALCQLIVALRAKAGSPEPGVTDSPRQRRRPAIFILILLLGYIIAMQLFGFLASSVVMMAAALAISAGALGKKHSGWVTLLLAVVFSVAAFILFDLLLDVPLPRGIWSVERLFGM
ncbi:MAG: tripartite tricarboxylate transporter TctB family protein [Desulfobacteraceae bacterium]|nr:MAG: tripartite tricarboxylate transporter TctB family protein [Desulfobacteraceae bacterium]